jgi:hypothetical protein
LLLTDLFSRRQNVLFQFIKHRAEKQAVSAVYGLSYLQIFANDYGKPVK